MAAPIISPTPTPVIGSFEKRQPVIAPVETHQPIIEVLAGSTADALQERASGGDFDFDSLLCATLKALKGENPTVFNGLLQSCTSLTDSSSTLTSRTKALKERNAVNDKKDLAADLAADVDGSGEAFLARSDTDLPGKRNLDINNIVEKRQDEGLENVV